MQGIDRAMADYTREEVIEKVKKGESLEEADLSDIDLSEVNLGSTNVYGLCEKGC